jgi:hypothetical protein
MSHPNDDLLQLHVDGRLSARANAGVAAHLAECERCRDRHVRLEEVVTSLRLLPTSIHPPVDLWGGIADRIAEDMVMAADAGARRFSPEIHRSPRWRRFTVTGLAAAAVLLIGVALGRTLSHPGSNGLAEVSVPSSSSATPRSSGPGPVTLVDDDPAYDQSVAELHAVLSTMANKLRPETVATIEENLRIIDAAIDEAREALAADPASDYLRRRITIYRQTKLDVLRAATGVIPPTEI